jgi:hypothetical protein
MKTVYWSPFSVIDKYPSVQLLYDTPDSLLQDLSSKRNKDSTGDNWFQCHAFQASIKNTFVLRLPFSTGFALDSDVGAFAMREEYESSMQYVQIKQPSILNAYTIAVRGNWIFWSEEPLTITTSPAHYHKPVFDGYYVGGSFDIGRWFRPVEGAIQLNEQVNTVHIKRHDPLAYIKFDTEEPIQLKRFYMTKELEELHWACVQYKQHDPHRGLSYLYDKFTNRGLDKVITKEIKRNVMN